MRRLPIEVHPGAEREVAHERNYYGKRSLRVKAKLDAEIDRGLEVISTYPTRFATYGLGTRAYRLKSFPLLIVYRTHSAHIEWVAFVHAKRKTKYWKDRLNP